MASNVINLNAGNERGQAVGTRRNKKTFTADEIHLLWKVVGVSGRLTGSRNPLVSGFQQLEYFFCFLLNFGARVLVFTLL